MRERVHTDWRIPVVKVKSETSGHADPRTVRRDRKKRSIFFNYVIEAIRCGIFLGKVGDVLIAHLRLRVFILMKKTKIPLIKNILTETNHYNNIFSFFARLRCNRESSYVNVLILCKCLFRLSRTRLFTCVMFNSEILSTLSNRRRPRR